MKRCHWPQTELEIKYHDEEWCQPNHDDRYLFEMLVLETMQAGLSWRTILEKRENYRELFYNFEVDKILKMSESKRQSLYSNEKIIRHKLKIDAIFHNAKIVKNMKQSLSDFMWSYIDYKSLINDVKDYEAIPAKDGLSEKISKDMKQMGFKFVGPTIIYSYMHAIGMIDDHENYCEYKTKSQ